MPQGALMYWRSAILVAVAAAVLAAQGVPVQQPGTQETTLTPAQVAERKGDVMMARKQ